MRKAVYDWLLRLPARIGAVAIALIGIAATLWPDEVRAMIGGGLPVERLALAAVLVVLAYVALLWVLKPSGKKPSYSLSEESLAGLTRVMSGQASGPTSGQLRSYARMDAMRRCPEMPVAQALAHLLSLGQSKEQARVTLQQAFSDGRLEVWGRPEVVPAHMQAPISAKEIWERVPTNYWGEFRLTEAAFDAEEDQPQTQAQQHVRKRLLRRYWSLRVSGEQVRGEWPEPPKPKPSTPDLGPNGWMAR